MKTKRLFSLLMTLALCLSLVPFTAVPAGAAWSGDGSPGNPYQIDSAEQLAKADAPITFTLLGIITVVNPLIPEQRDSGNISTSSPNSKEVMPETCVPRKGLACG